MARRQNPNAMEREWMNRITRFGQENGVFPHLRMANQFDRHHVVGRTYIHNKIEIGHIFILPIEFQYHDIHSNNPFNVTNFRKRYMIEFDSQRNQFAKMCEIIKEEDGELPFPDEVLDAIMSTSY